MLNIKQNGTSHFLGIGLGVVGIKDRKFVKHEGRADWITTVNEWKGINSASHVKFLDIRIHHDHCAVKDIPILVREEVLSHSVESLV